MSALHLVLLLGCAGGGTDPGVTALGPVLSHEAPEAGLAEGSSTLLVVSAEDPDGVEEVVLWHRRSGEEWWDTTALEDQGDGTWAVLYGPLQAPGHDYWFRATDLGQPSSASDLPEEGEALPLHLLVSRQALALPFEEGFEGADEPSELGWWTPSTGTAGYAWELTDATAQEGEQAAVHLRGAASAGVLEDWLVGPVLDLSEVGTAMVSWHERGAGTDAADHRLWVSTGSRDPADGEFVEVAVLTPPPEGAWGRAPAVDLSAWAGQGEVILAWSTAGQAADDWWIDSVAVTERGVDLVDATLSWSPDPAAPGETVTLTLTARNAMDAGAEAATASLVLPEGGGVLAADTVEAGAVDPLGTVQARFELQLDAGLAEPSVVPLQATVEAGGDAWTWDLQLVVGQPAEAVLAWTQASGAVVEVELGVGDPDDPLLLVPVGAAWHDAGSHELTVDLTALGAWLPPAAGPLDRWYARIDAGSDGQVDAFSIAADGVLHEASLLPAWSADLPAVVYVPQPPVPVVQAVSTEPDPVAPGAAGVALSLTLANEGAATAGPLLARLLSEDPDAVVTGGEERVLAETPWEPGETLVLDELSLAVAASHVDSSPVVLRLELDDGVDQWSQAVVVEVPWPVPRVVGLVIADSGGDGLLDGGEQATVTVTIGNGGALATQGELWLSATVSESSAVEATVELAAGDDTGEAALEASLGALEPDDRASVDLVLDLGPGDAGQPLDLVLSLRDDASAWTVPVQLVLGEAPWIALAPSTDPAGDAVGGYALDLVDARFRQVDGVFQLEVLSATAFDLDTVFFEAWGRSTGAPYSYYRWVVQPGAADLQGYVSGSGFTDIGILAATAPDAFTLRLEWALADMELAAEAFTIGLAAGWCGPDTYYCDHHPDGWGYPYVSFSSAMFFPVDW